MPSGRDPRSYVKQVPLPIPSQLGLKLQARDTFHFNPCFPTREDVRKENYNRRKEQMSSMGFRSKREKPYIGIGDPFYLEEKKLILHALGQWDEADDESSSTSEEEDEDSSCETKTQKPSFTAAKFVLRRSRKDLNTLSKEVANGRRMIRNVKLGVGLFDVINREKQRKKSQQEAENRKLKELARNEWLPPKTGSDESETDDDLQQDEELSSFMVPLSMSTTTSVAGKGDTTDEELGIQEDTGTSSDSSPERDQATVVTFSSLARAEEEEEWKRGHSGVPTSEALTFSRPGSFRKLKKQQMPRPYTPQHTNLSTNLSSQDGLSKDAEDISRDALFRQLCVLHWVLEAMSTDPPSPMSPITQCWSLTDIGGSRAEQRKLKREKVADTTWSNFITNNPSGRRDSAKVTKRLSSTKIGKTGRRHPFSRTSLSSVGQGSVLNTPTTPTHPLSRVHESVSDEHSPNASHDDEDEATYNKSIFKFLDEYYESLKREEELKKEEHKDEEATSPTPEKRKKEKRHSEGEGKSKKSKKKKKQTEERKSSPKLTGARLASRNFRANALVKAKSSPELQLYQSTLPSNKRVVLCQDLQNKLAEVQEDKALTLHDILEHKERQRMTVCHSKFMALGSSVQGSSFHRAVENMRSQSWQMLRKPQEQMRKKSQVKGNWYIDLMDKIPEEMKQEWYYCKILDKLGKFGLPSSSRKREKKALVEGTGKQSIYKFLKVLEGLREWEICSPDVTAAIEFCREQIVDMTIDEYEDWFRQQFPKVTRPQTAPAAVKSEKKDHEEGREAENPSSESKAVPRVVHSAAIRRIQR